jgi:hypothetical protein
MNFWNWLKQLFAQGKPAPRPVTGLATTVS